MRHGAFGTVYVPTADEDRAEAFLVGKAREASTDEQAVAAIHEAMLLVASFERLRREARARFRPRFAHLAKVLKAGIEQDFPGL